MGPRPLGAAPPAEPQRSRRQRGRGGKSAGAAGGERAGGDGGRLGIGFETKQQLVGWVGVFFGVFCCCLLGFVLFCGG